MTHDVSCDRATVLQIHPAIEVAWFSRSALTYLARTTSHRQCDCSRAKTQRATAPFFRGFALQKGGKNGDIARIETQNDTPRIYKSP